jgi:cellulose synthase/poly-beta-1,6-N-acetylglucosamine synthase-like glycosyltransferase
MDAVSSSLTVVIPALNEGEGIKETLERVRAALSGYDCEIVVVDDGSTDSTGEIAGSRQRCCASCNAGLWAPEHGISSASTMDCDNRRGRDISFENTQLLEATKADSNGFGARTARPTGSPIKFPAATAQMDSGVHNRQQIGNKLG